MLRQGFDTRGVSTVTAKTLELAIGILFIAVVTALLFGVTVSEYQAAVGEELAERTLDRLATQITAAIPADSVRLNRQVRVQIPARIHSQQYQITAISTEQGAILALTHPSDRIAAQRVVAVSNATVVHGEIQSEAVVTIHLKHRMQDASTLNYTVHLRNQHAGGS